MFTIQYTAVNGESKLQTLDSNSRQKLLDLLARFERPIVAVYEQASPITKTIRKDLVSYPGGLSQPARDFISSLR